MDKISAVIELLAKLGLNFWQILAFVVIMMFRKQIFATFGRITSIKSPIGEIGLERAKLNVIEKMETVQNVISALPDDNEIKNEMSEGLQSLNRALLIAALDRIRMNTTFLWPDLESLAGTKKTTVHTITRTTTFLKIRNDLDLLKRFNLLKYGYTGEVVIKDTNQDVLKLTIYDIQEELFELIKDIQKIVLNGIIIESQ